MKRLTDDELLRINEAAHHALYSITKKRDEYRATLRLVDSGTIDIFDIVSMVREIQESRKGNGVEPVEPRKPCGLVHRVMFEQVREERDKALSELDDIAAAVYSEIGPLEGVGDLEGTTLERVEALIRKYVEMGSTRALVVADVDDD